MNGAMDGASESRFTSSSGMDGVAVTCVDVCLLLTRAAENISGVGHIEIESHD